MSEAAARIEQIDPFAELDAVFEIYCAALGAPTAAVETQRWRDETRPRHAARRGYVSSAPARRTHGSSGTDGPARVVLGKRLAR